MAVRRYANAGGASTLDLDACMACGQVCELTGSFDMPGLQGPERYVRTRCVAGHVMVGPQFALRAHAA
jgi:hypothetical protein